MEVNESMITSKWFNFLSGIEKGLIQVAVAPITYNSSRNKITPIGYRIISLESRKENLSIVY